MSTKLLADASPEKRLFISLLTRDIPLAAAILDLIDNSINSAVEPYSARLTSAQDYVDLFGDPDVTPSAKVVVSVSEKQVTISDTAGGISAETARDHVFKFGRANDESHEHDRLSVYGIGLKRALFKLGNKISITSDHPDGGFDLKLNVAKWARTTEQPWGFEITTRDPVPVTETGTKISVSELSEDVSRRIGDGVFIAQLQEAIARTYAYYLAKIVTIEVNGKQIEPINIEIGSNHTSDTFSEGGVTCAITAGIGTPQAGAFRDKSSGWFVFCNGRTVISADKTSLTGWQNNGLPIFQPKHRPFLGTVFFVSENPEQLPWTTTKAGINEDSAIWQTAKRHMTTIGRVVISFLDSRYTDDGTELASKELQEASGSSSVSVLSAAVSKKSTFKAPSKPAPTTTRIQYDALVSDVKKVAVYLDRPGMSGSDVGRHTFQYFLRNEVGEK